MKRIYNKPLIHAIEMGKVILVADSKGEDGQAEWGLTKGTDMCTWDDDEEDEADNGEYRDYEVQWNYGW